MNCFEIILLDRHTQHFVVSIYYDNLVFGSDVLFFFIFYLLFFFFFFFSSRRRHTRCSRDWSSDVCSSDLEKVVLIQIAVPTREGIDTYQDLRTEVNRLVGEINGKLGTPNWTPVVYINRSIERAELGALYKLADVCWVGSLRDGMNLVAKEYVACKAEGDGVLVEA